MLLLICCLHLYLQGFRIFMILFCNILRLLAFLNLQLQIHIQQKKYKIQFSCNYDFCLYYIELTSLDCCKITPMKKMLKYT